jgi:quinolinate synthase
MHVPAAAVRQDVQEKADELNVEAHGMRARLAAGDNQINALVAEIALLERLNQEAATSRLLELEALTTTCKKMEAQVSVRQLKVHVTLAVRCAYSTRDVSRARVQQAY